MKLTSTLRDEEYATKVFSGDQDRDLKHTILIQKKKRYNRMSVTKTYRGHKVNFSDITYMLAIQDTVMAEDIEEKAEEIVDELPGDF